MIEAYSLARRLIRDGFALPFTAHAASPTITMPRIKAITTGSVPSFLDVILNFAESDTTSTLANQDTWLAQMKAKDTGKMVMYGDDTWLKLFPETFDRVDGTSSFFVADFTEVDNNVTRHVPEELAKDDWNTMVLHYLGLDHIGHKAGPRSPNMIPKQQEMDAIVEQVYSAMVNHAWHERTLLVLAGDHGMNDAGNHGGSGEGETSPALVFIAPKLQQISREKPSPILGNEGFQYYSTIEQSDIAPTLAGLLGFPVPKNNLGVFIPDFLAFWLNEEAQIELLLQNARQILRIVTATFSPALFDPMRPMSTCQDSDIDRLGCSWVSIQHKVEASKGDGPHDVEELLTSLSKWSRDAQEIMSRTASNYDMTKLTAGQVIAAVAACLAVAASYPIFARSFTSTTPFIAVTVSYAVMMFASSYVEEEQHFWYWTASAWLVLLSVQGISRYAKQSTLLTLASIAILALLRVARRWNQTGQKYAGSPDIARTFLSEHPDLLWFLIAAAYLWNASSLAISGFPWLPRQFALVLAATLMIIAITFKVSFTHEDAPELIGPLANLILDTSGSWTLVQRARLVFYSLSMCLALVIGPEFWYPHSGQRLTHGFRRSSPRTLHHLLFLLLLTQSCATNIPLLLIFQVQLSLLSRLPLSQLETTTTSLLLQYASFFALGGSNAISSIDLSSAYNGVSGYNVLAVGLLTFAGNWAGPIFWTSGTVLLLLNLRARGKARGATVEAPGAKDGAKGGSLWQNHLSLLTLFASVSTLSVMVACTVLRTHLFIWTVFSPKYLYAMAWCFGQHLAVNGGLGSVLWWFGTR